MCGDGFWHPWGAALPAQVRFNAEIIGELRRRAIAHNALVKSVGAQTKLGELKTLYRRHHTGDNPRAHALTKIDQHLARIQGGELLKARGAFDSGEHPRGPGGEFRSTGDTHNVRQIGLVNRHTTRISTGSGQADPDLLDAAQTQVIPETRYSVLGPPAAGAVGVILGAAAGANATMRGSLADRLATRAVTHVGGRIGGIAGRIAAVPLVDVPHHATRAVIGQINRRTGTTIPRSAPDAHRPAVRALTAGGNRVGRIAGAAVGHGSAVFATGPAAIARSSATRLAGGGGRGQIAGRLAGALIGAAWPGALLYGPSLAHAQATVGPYEDTLFPRRVKKMLDDPAVLAKQGEIFASDLAKADFFGIARRLLTSAARTRPSISGLAHLHGPFGPTEEAARTTFAQHAASFTVPSRRIGRAAVIASRGLAIGGASAAVGAISGAALAAFNQKHPRSPGGQFTRKASAAAKRGATIGGAVGAGLGLLAGVAAARRGQTALLTQALARLRGTETVGTATQPLPTIMRAQARRLAQVAHAHAYRDANQRRIPAFTGSGHEPEQVTSSIKAHAIARWMEGEGRAIQAGAKAWYTHQVDKAFDAEARDKIWRLGPVLDPHGATVTRGTTNLINNVDPEKLSTNQRRIWDDLVVRRQKVLGEVDQVYTARTEATKEVANQVSDLRAEKTRLTRAVSAVPDRWDDMKGDAKLPEIRAFARDHLGHELQARTRETAVGEVDNRLPVWQHETDVRLGRVDNELGQDVDLAVTTARNAEVADLTEQEAGAIVNPFARGKDRFLRNRPAGADTQAGFTKIREAIGDRAAAPFLREAMAHAHEAEQHLEEMLVGQETALQARVPRAGATARMFHRFAPLIAAQLHQGALDYSAIVGARRATLTGFQKQAADWLRMNSDPRQAWDTAKTLATAAGTRGKRAGAFTLRNWKPIASIVGPLLAGGIIDISGPHGKILNLDPKKWKRPRNLGVVHEWPDVIRRPHEALFGVSYQSPDGRRRFLHGIHIHSEKGDFHDIPFGTDVDQVVGSIRGQGGNRNVEPVKVQNPKVVDDAISSLQRSGNIRDVGPEGFEFKRREGGAGGQAETEYSRDFFKEHLSYLPPQAAGEPTRKQNSYFASLDALFGDQRARVLDLSATAQLLVGNHVPVANGGKRGIFGNQGSVFKAPNQADKTAVAQEIMRNLWKHQADNEEKYSVLRQATWVVAEYYGLGEAERTRIKGALDQQFTKASAKQPPGEAPARTESADPAGNTLDIERGGLSGNRFADELVRDIPASNRPGTMKDDTKFRDHIVAAYNSHYRLALRNDTDLSEHAARTRAERGVREVLRAAGVTGMTKLAKAITGSAVDRPRIRPPSLRGPQTGASMAPPITGAAVAGSATPRAKIQGGALRAARPATAPAIGRTTGQIGTSPAAAPHAPSVAAGLRQAVKPEHALSQIGGYGAAQGTFRALEHAAAGLIPGGRVVDRVARFAIPAIGGVAGWQAGTKGGAAAGRGIGGRARAHEPGAGESLARAGGGLVGSMAGEAAGAAIGSVVPVAGTVAGGIIGAGLGGYLGDEGAGILFRHLSHYGAHVPAKIMGHQAATAAHQRQTGAVR